MSFDWRSLVRSVAPMLGTALGGPLGGMAGAALAKSLGAPDASDSALEAAFKGASPEQLLAVQKAEQDFKVQMAQLGFESERDLEKIAADDRANAREREVKTGDSWTPRGLAALVVAAWIAVQFYLLGHVVDQAMRDIIMRMLGTLDAALTLVLAYYFGSSSGSARKDEVIARGQK